MTETQNTSRRPGALIAMSGGVDSSVAAWLMQRDGFDCTGVTMRLTRNEAVTTEGLHTCCSERDIEDAAEVAYACLLYTSPRPRARTSARMPSSA